MMNIKEIQKMIDERPPDSGFRPIDYIDYIGICPHIKDYKKMGNIFKDLTEIAKKQNISFIFHNHQN